MDSVTANDDDETCAVCFDPMNGDRKTDALSCGHRFHLECLRRCLELKASCPYCRAPCDEASLLSTAEEVRVSQHLAQCAAALAKIASANPAAVTFLDGAEERFPIAVLGAQRTEEFWQTRGASLAQLEEAVVSIGQEICRFPKPLRELTAAGLTQRGSSELVSIGPHSFLYTPKAVFVHRWQSAEAAVRFRRVYDRMWSVIAEHHLCVIRAPTMFTFVHQGSYVTAACVPRVAPGFPLVGLHDVKADGMTGHFMRLFLVALGVSPSEAAAMFLKGQGNHVVAIDVAGLLSASLPRFASFPHVMARTELEQHAGWPPQRGACDDFVREVAVPRALDRLVDPVLHLDERRNRSPSAAGESRPPSPANSELSVEMLVLGRRLAQQLHASGVSLAFLEDVRRLAMHRASVALGPSERGAYLNIAAAATMEMVGRTFKCMARTAMGARDGAASKMEELGKLARQLGNAGFWSSSLVPAARAKYGYGGELLADIGGSSEHNSRIVLAVATSKLGLAAERGPKRTPASRTAYPRPAVHLLGKEQQRREVTRRWEAACSEPDALRAEAAAVRAMVASVLTGFGADFEPCVNVLLPQRSASCRISAPTQRSTPNTNASSPVDFFRDILVKDFRDFVARSQDLVELLL